LAASEKLEEPFFCLCWADLLKPSNIMQAIDYLHCKAISYLAFLKLIYMYILLQNSTKTFHTVATYGLE
jgi:hypothetical protein